LSFAELIIEFMFFYKSIANINKFSIYL